MIMTEEKKELEMPDISEIPAIADDVKNRALDVLTKECRDDELTELTNENVVKLCARAEMQGLACNDGIRVKAVEVYKRNMKDFKRQARSKIEEIATTPEFGEFPGADKASKFERFKQKLGMGKQ